MGNAASATQDTVFHGFDNEPSRDLRPPFAQLLEAAAEARAFRMAGYARDSARKQRSSVESEIKQHDPVSASMSPTTTTSSTSIEVGEHQSRIDDNDTAAATSVASAMGFMRRPTVSTELKEAATKLLKGDLSEDVIKRLLDRTAVCLYISCSDTGISHFSSLFQSP